MDAWSCRSGASPPRQRVRVPGGRRGARQRGGGNSAVGDGRAAWRVSREMTGPSQDDGGDQCRPGGRHLDVKSQCDTSPAILCSAPPLPTLQKQTLPTQQKQRRRHNFYDASDRCGTRLGRSRFLVNALNY